MGVFGMGVSGMMMVVMIVIIPVVVVMVVMMIMVVIGHHQPAHAGAEGVAMHAVSHV